MSRDGFVFYASFYQAMMKMSKADRLPFVEALCAYALEDKEPELTGSADLAFCLIKPQLDANIKRRDNGAKGKGFGVLGGRPKESKTDGDIDKNPIGVINGNPKQTPNVNVKDNVNVNVNVKDKEKDKENIGKVAVAPSVFRKPSITEIVMYCKARNNNVDAEAFWNFYESKGWKVGNATMKDWKAAVITWEKRRKEDGNNQKYSTTEQRTMVCHDWSNEHPTL